MPFTPVHLGPAALLKGLLGVHFSFVVFGGSQILIDLEPLIQIIRGEAILHGPSHTVLGALLIGTLAALLGKPIGQIFLNLIKISETHISWRTSALSAYLGTFSHILLDGIMHSDMSPWSPFYTNNSVLGLVSISNLHYFCVIAGLIGGSIVGIKCFIKNNA